MTVPSIGPSPKLREHKDDIPESVKNYFVQQPASLGKAQLSSHKPIVQIEQFRGLSNMVLAEGWSGLEPWGVWSDGNHAVLYVRNIVKANTEIILTANGAVSEFHRRLTIQLALGTAREQFIFAWPDTIASQIELTVPADLACETVLRLAIDIDNPLSPYEQSKGASPDRRRTGLGIRSVEFKIAVASQNERSDMQPQFFAAGAVTDRQDYQSAHANVGLGVSSVIAITMVYNEGDTLRRWLKHYGRHLGERNLLVVDDGSNDGSTDNLGVAGRLTIPKLPFDEGRRAEFVSDLQRDLLRYCNAVIYTDCDEFLIPDPRRFANLRQYVDRMSAECVRPVAFNLFHIRDQEQALVTDRGLLEQRSYCQFYSRECKPLVTRVPIRWTAGFHDCNMKVLLDSELLLVHAKQADYSAALARLALTRNLTWSERIPQRHVGATIGGQAMNS